MQGFDLFGDLMEVATKPTFVPRDYQIEAARRVIDILSGTDRTAVYIATGCGKTEVAALLCLHAGYTRRIIVIAPRRELVKQTADRLRLRGVECGIEMAEQRSEERITVACYASLMSRQRYKRYLDTVDLIIVDESHTNYSPAALQMLAEFRSFGARVCGMTASPPHKKNGVLIDGHATALSDHYGEPAYIYDYLQAAANGHLLKCRLHTCVLEDLDMSRFRQSFGDFDQTRVDKLMRKRANVAGVGLMVFRYWDGKPSVVFCCSIEHAEAVRDDLASRGIAASIVHSKMDDEEQRMHLADYESGRSNLILNVGILTMGWDSPRTCKLFLARPTCSSTLYVQMFGRATRCEPGCIDGIDTVEGRLAAIAASGKPDFEVFDITDSSRNNSICNAMSVLYPDIDDRLMKKVRRRFERAGGKPLPIDPVIEEERKILAAETAAAEAAAMRQRAYITVDGEVVAYRREVDAEVETRGGGKRVTDYWWMPYGKYKGRKFSAIPRRYLEVLLPHVKDAGLARNIKRYLDGRQNKPAAQPVSEYQRQRTFKAMEDAGSRLLRSEGYDPDKVPF